MKIEYKIELNPHATEANEYIIIASDADYQAAAENKNLGQCWMPTNLGKTQCLAYEYF